MSKMKYLLTFLILCIASTVAANDDSACTEYDSVNAIYGNIEKVERELIEFAQMQLNKSFTYLLLGAHFGGHTYNRQGLKKMYNELSDELWEATIDVIKHISERGGSMKSVKLELTSDIKVNELEAIAVALDYQKDLAKKANLIINKIIEIENNSIKDESDPEITHYLEDKFLSKYSKQIRKLAGYSTDLKRMLQVSETKALGMEVFDTYLANN